MPTYKVLALETRVHKMLYTVEADDASQAITKATIGNTTHEQELDPYDCETIHREVDHETLEKVGG